MYVPLLLIVLLELRSSKTEPLDKKYTISELVKSTEDWSLMNGQVPEDVIYNLAGNKKLVTIDELTGKFHTFNIYEDGNGIPYVKDPDTGHKYLVMSSIVRKDVDIYRIFENEDGPSLVINWADMTVNKIQINKYGEPFLVPVSD